MKIGDNVRLKHLHHFDGMNNIEERVVVYQIPEERSGLVVVVIHITEAITAIAVVLNDPTITDQVLLSQVEAQDAAGLVR